MRPFLLLATRDHDGVADAEYASFLQHMGLREDQLARIRLERDPEAPIEPGKYSGILLGGSPFNSSAPLEDKSELQVRIEARLRQLLDVVVAEDIPFFGACYGIGTLGVHQGGVVDGTYAEDAGPIRASLTDAGREDPLCAGLPESFDVFVGHREAVRELPPGAVLLASGPACPVQMFRIRENLYATQFHPELDAESLIDRLQVYRDRGYVPPGEFEATSARARAADPTAGQSLLRRFAQRYGS